MNQLLEKLNSLDIKIGLRGENLDIQAPKGIITTEILEEIRGKKVELINFLKDFTSKPVITKVAETEFYPLSSTQKRMWLLHQMNPDNAAYHIPMIFEIEGDFSFDKLQNSLQVLLQRHESLRTKFSIDSQGNPVQVIQHYTDDLLNLIIKDSQKPEEIQKSIEELINTPFDLSKDVLFKANVFKESDDKHILLIIMHHIISDGWSLEVFAKDFFAIYNQENLNNLNELSIQYKDYAVWQQNRLGSNELNEDKDYWLSVFSEQIPVLQLPSFKPRPKVKSGNGKTILTQFSSSSLSKFQKVCQDNHATLFMGIKTLVDVLLFKYTNQKDIIIGTPIANRELQELENQIGFYANTLALRTNVEKTQSFLNLLQYNKTQLLEAYKHQEYPFDELVSNLKLPYNSSRNPLFDVMISLQENSNSNIIALENTTIKKIIPQDETSKFDLTFSFHQEEDKLNLELNYDSDIYEEFFIKNLIAHFSNILEKVARNSDQLISEIEIATAEERHQLLYEFNNTKVDYPKDKTIVELFEEQVAKTPDSIAVVFEDVKLTYLELNEKANQLASFLRINHAVKVDDLVGIVLDRSANLIISILGVLKSGAAYVPIDPNYPQERIDFIVADSNCKVIIDTNFFKLFNFTNYSKENVDKVNFYNDLAYVIYTSGTTGKPKGVMIEHRNLVNICYWHTSSFSVDTKSRGTLFSGVGFDASVWEIFPYLINGSCLFPIKNDEIKLNINEYSNFIKGNKISHSYLPSAICNEVAKSEFSFDNVKFLTGGETLKIETPSNIEIYNNYGPTENTIVSTFYKLGSNKIGAIPIGRPISNTQVYILDEDKRVVPIGVTGKLFVSGVGLSRGYLNKPELTAEKFVDNPFVEGTKMYDTGDLARWLPDGNIEFLGRADFQVKIRGYRIELGEIETSLSQFSQDIAQVVVEAKEINSEKVLVAYYTTREDKEIDKTILREYLQSKLPEYMVPSYFVELETIPLTPNGKIDRKGLPSVSGEDVIRREYIGPRNETEQKLAEIWQEVLGVENIGITDSFFELGGHSLMAAQVLNKIHQRLSLQISFKDFFATPTIEGISKNLSHKNYVAIPKASVQENYPLTPSQQRLWVLSQLEGGSQAYNMPAVVRLKGELDITNFEKAFQELIARHEILLTCFRSDKNTGEIRQYINAKEKVTFNLTVLDFQNADSVAIENYLQQTNAEAFDLEQGPLLRASLLQQGANEYVFFLSMHHIIGDGWSTELLISEVVNNYNSLLQGKTIASEELPIQYKDYAVWLQEEIKGEKYEKAEEYWLEQFSGELPVLDLPSYKTRPLIQTYNGDNISQLFSKEFTSKLKQYSEDKGVTLFMTLMAGIKALMYRYTGQTDLVIGTPIAGREHPDLENQIGLYLNTLAIRTQLEEDANSFASLLQKEKEVLLGAYEHQLYPFDELVGKLNLKRDTSRSALFDVLVVLQNQNQLRLGDTTNDIKSLEVEEYDYHRKTSKFDITYTFLENDTQLGLNIQYNTDIYDLFLIERTFSHLESLLTQAIENDTQLIETIDFLTTQERHQLLYDFNDNKVDYPKDKIIVELFEEQVAKKPDSVAVVFEGKKIKYKELSEQVNYLANNFQANNISKGSNVVLCFNRNINEVVSAILAVLKVGATYVPIDSDYPTERIKFIIEDADAKVVITDDVDLFEWMGIPVITTNTKIDIKILEENRNINLEDTAYIIYTSGSTGNPKGVLVNHQNLNDYLFGLANKIPIEKNESFALMSTIATDLGNTVLFSSLLFGKTLHLFSKDSLRDVDYIQNYFRNNEIDCIKIVPSYWKSLEIHSEIKSPNKMIIFGGEELTVEIVEKIKSDRSQVKIINHYGPTETTIGKLLHIVDSEKKYSRVPIGQAFSNTSLYVVDKNLSLCPIGVEGELLIGGDGVSNGYLNNQELTQEKFIKNELTKTSGKLYRTGDNVVMHTNGDIEFRGRIDNQVKILGHRIELNEIENALNKFNDIKASVANVVKTDNGNKTIVAYIVCDKEELPYDEIINHLRSLLPSIMIPTRLIKIEEIPFTSNGKIDRKALPSVSGEDLIRREYIAPRNATEEQLVTIWQEVLGVENIGITDSFFELGGHSLMVAQVLNKIHQRLSLQISFKDFFATPTIEGISKNLTHKNYVAIPKAAEQESYPLTPSQQRLWVLSQLEGGSQAYNMPAVVRLKGALDIANFEKAFQELIARHEILRTCFRSDKNTGEIRQYINVKEDITFNLTVLDYQDADSVAIENYLQQTNAEAFDLEQGPLLRASLLQQGSNEYVFFLSMHHIIGDGWSTELLISEVVNNYNSLLQGRAITTTVLPIQYKDYAVWLQEEIKGEKYEKAEKYWLEQFSGELPVLDLPSYKTRPLIQTYNGDNVSQLFSAAFTSKLKQYSEDKGVTLFMTLMAGIKALLYRYTGQTDLVIGTPIAGREHPDLENQIGLYLNTLAIRTQLEEDSNSFASLLQKEKEVLLGAYEHQLYPFDELVGKLNLKRDTSRSALFDVLVVLQNQNQLRLGDTTNDIKSLEVEGFDYHRKISKFDVSYTFAELNDQLGLTIEYNTDIYDLFLIERMFTHLESLLTQAIENDTQLIETIDFLTIQERQQLVYDFNDTKVDYPKDKTIIELFEDQVTKTPDSVAVVFEQKELTYEEIDKKSNQFANYILSKSTINLEDRVCVKIDKSEWIIIVLLGIVKTGAAYLPIDPNYPEERKKYLEEASDCVLSVDDNLLNDFIENISLFNTNFCKVNINQRNLFHIMFTSGSTGNPKGVMIDHSNIVNFVTTNNYFILNKYTVLLSTVATSFDTTNMEFWGVLANGGKLVLAQKNDLFDYAKLKDIILKNDVNSLWFTASWFSQIVDFDISIFKPLKQFISGGDILSMNHINKLTSTYPDLLVYNGYGPTENTTFSTIFQVKSQLYNSIPVGKPIPNTQVYIVNDKMEPQPIGVFGKIYVSGLNLARGYYKNEKLTEEKFVDSPFIKEMKVYDTGDIGRWMVNGNIEFLGRKDNLVKIRGYRIELEEIETKILQYSDKIKQVCLDLRIISGEKVLVAYLVLNSTLDKSELREFLLNNLPDYMVPGYYVELDSLPLTPNGKTDKKALPEIEAKDLIRTEYLTPINDLEYSLLEIWKEVLSIETISTIDNFFEIGGNSIKLIKLVSIINIKFKSSIKINELFVIDTIKKQAISLADVLSDSCKESEDVNLSYINKISSSQKRWIVTNLIDKKGSSHNIVRVLNIDSDITKEHVYKFFFYLVKKHEILRSVFYENEDELLMKVIEVRDVSINIKEVHKDSVELEELVERCRNHYFSFENFPLFNIYIQDKVNLVLVFHHLIFDAWSFGILEKEWVKYSSNEISFLDYQYKDHVINEQMYFGTDRYLQDKEYFLKKFRSSSFKDTIFPLRKNNDNIEGILSFVLNTDELNLIKTNPILSSRPLNIVLLTFFYQTIHEILQNNEITIGIPISGRDDKNVDLIGFFPKMVMLKVDIEESTIDLLEKIQNEFNLSLFHSNYPYDQLLNDLKISIPNDRFPLSSVFFNMVESSADAIEYEDEIVYTPLSNKTRYDFNAYVYEYQNYIDFKIRLNTSKINKEIAFDFVRKFKNKVVKISQIK
ncbi:amino acid adenylation domain-containing protein [Flavobacterium columnare]|uniref:amino acid adenylation domain-containing protein n=1 Tax=Flavobacterium columnare TaxID=996 RepID=UPI0040345782